MSIPSIPSIQYKGAWADRTACEIKMTSEVMADHKSDANCNVLCRCVASVAISRPAQLRTRRRAPSRPGRPVMARPAVLLPRSLRRLRCVPGCIRDCPRRAAVCVARCTFLDPMFCRTIPIVYDLRRDYSCG